MAITNECAGWQSESDIAVRRAPAGKRRGRTTAQVNDGKQGNQYITLKIKRRTVQCLVDTWSSKSIISANLAKTLKLRFHQDQDGITSLVAATGHNLKIQGKTDITLQINGLLVPHTFLIVDGLYPSLLLGTDFLTKNSAFIDYVEGTVRFYDHLVILPLQSFNTLHNCATVKQTMCIPRLSEAIIAVNIPKTFRGSEVMLESLPNTPCPVMVGGSLTKIKNNVGYLRVLN